MATDKINAGGFGVRGHVTLWQVDEKTGLKIPVCDQPNQIQYSWGFVAAKQLGYRASPDRPSYHISAMYIEFENQADPTTEVTVSSFPRDLGISYYNGLFSVAHRDFLRVPLSIEPAASVSAGFEANLPIDQQANQLTFFVQTAGTTGVHGKTFSHTVNSKVYAVSLIAAPSIGDRTKDVVFARTTFSAANQVTKEASSQIGITWDVAFE
jgi:hypothetical protein